jgi:hypothetical protein
MQDTFSLPGRTTWVRCNGQKSDVSSIVARTYQQTKVGQQNPFWRDQIERRQNATTPYQRSGVRLIEWKPFKVTRRLTGKPCGPTVSSSAFLNRTWEGSHTGLPALTVSMSDTEAMNKAIMQFVSDHDSQSTSLLGGVYLKEWKQVRNMIRNPAKALWKEVERYHRAAQQASRRAKSTDVPTVLSDLWLEYSFGWVPLISDTEAAAQAAAKVLERDYGVYVIRGFGRQESSSETIRTWAPSGAIRCGTLREVRKNSNIVVIKGGLSPSVSGPTMPVHALQQLGFTPNSFVPTVWEVIPYSFLADYFINVGDVLRATFHSWGDLTWSSMARVGYSHFISSILPITPKETDYTWSVDPGKLMLTAQSFVRTAPSSSAFVPKLAFTLPGQATQWLNLAALARMKSVR